MNTLLARACALLLLTAAVLQSQVPQLINYQGRVAVGAVNFDGTGQFKFALVDAAGTTTYWSNDGTSTAGSEPATAVALTVTKGLYTVLLGDATLPNMTVVPATVFTNAGVHLRVWFNDGANGSQRLSPDQRIAAVGYAMMAANAASVPDGAITAAKIAPGAAAANLNAGNQSAVASGGVVLSTTENPALINAGYVRLGMMTTGDAWLKQTDVNAPAGRQYHTVVWTGSEMIVWGGHDGSSPLNTGGRFNPVTNTWSPVATTGAPAARYTHTAIWSGSEMIVWGGQGSSLFHGGDRYNLATNTWSAVNTAGAPGGRYSHTAVWTGSEMIVWGGFDGSFLDDGGRYNPAANSWSSVLAGGWPPGRRSHTAVWTGSEMIIWGGSSTTYFDDGARYRPATNTWTAVSVAGAPPKRHLHTAVWTGTQMIIWGGSFTHPFSPQPNFLGDGGRYTPATNTWELFYSYNNAPGASDLHTAVWTGSEMIVWGGQANHVGGRYNTTARAWTPLISTGAPGFRYNHTAVWTGTEMIVWGGFNGGTHFNDAFSYSPGRVMILYQRP